MIEISLGVVLYGIQFSSQLKPEKAGLLGVLQQAVRTAAAGECAPAHLPSVRKPDVRPPEGRPTYRQQRTNYLLESKP